MTGAAGKAIRVARGYWPLLALLPVAGVIHGVLVALGDPWSPAEWASNIVFAYVVTLATVLLSRRQGKLQESTASMELIEKIAAVTGALDDLRGRCHASTAQQILTDARAGLHLLRYADPPSRQEYLETIRAAVARLYDLATDSVRTYTRWNAEEWNVLRRAAGQLRSALDDQVRSRRDVRSDAFLASQDLLRAMQGMDRSGNEVPFETFERSFRHGDVSQRIRAALNWELLRDHVTAGRARVQVHRQWSVAWLETYTPFAVWYATKGRAFAYYYYNDIHPIRLSEIDLYFDGLPRDSAATIDSMANTLELRPHGSLPLVEIVTVQLPMDQLLVIDGNHRIAAVCRTRANRARPISVDIVEYRITAPLESDLLPDLRHHAPAAGDHDTRLAEDSLSGL